MRTNGEKAEGADMSTEASLQDIKQRPSWNYIESFYEIEMTPLELRNIAAEMEKISNDFHLPGQVIRFKLSGSFALVYKPEKSRMRSVETSGDVGDARNQAGERDWVHDPGIGKA